jgi:hypothetical protein
MSSHPRQTASHRQYLAGLRQVILDCIQKGPAPQRELYDLIWNSGLINQNVSREMANMQVHCIVTDLRRDGVVSRDRRPGRPVTVRLREKCNYSFTSSQKGANLRAD